MFAVVLAVLVLAGVLVGIALARVREAEMSASATRHYTEVMAWCGTNVYNECFEPGCTPPPLSFGECRFYYLYEQDRLATQEAQRTPAP